MKQNEKNIAFNAKDLKGSRLRCMMFTNLPDERIADHLTNLVQPYATVRPDDVWMPRGFQKPDEARMGESKSFLSAKQRETITAWWLKKRGRANTPNWDIASTCVIGGCKGIVLVEAKAHENEFQVTGDNCGSENKENRIKIKSAISEANAGLNGDGQTRFSGWSLSEKGSYQLSNRFAWSWKIASLGVPVILIYLGFLNAWEMKKDGDRILTSTKHWQDYVTESAKQIVPPEAWGKRLVIGSTSFIPLIRALDVNVSVSN